MLLPSPPRSLWNRIVTLWYKPRGRRRLVILLAALTIIVTWFVVSVFMSLYPHAFGNFPTCDQMSSENLYHCNITAVIPTRFRQETCSSLLTCQASYWNGNSYEVEWCTPALLRQYNRSSDMDARACLTQQVLLGSTAEQEGCRGRLADENAAASKFSDEHYYHFRVGQIVPCCADDTRNRRCHLTNRTLLTTPYDQAGYLLARTGSYGLMLGASVTGMILGALCGVLPCCGIVAVCLCGCYRRRCRFNCDPPDKYRIWAAPSETDVRAPVLPPQDARNGMDEDGNPYDNYHNRNNYNNNNNSGGGGGYMVDGRINEQINTHFLDW